MWIRYKRAGSEGERRTENGERRMENGERKTEKGEGSKEQGARSGGFARLRVFCQGLDQVLKICNSRALEQ